MQGMVKNYTDLISELTQGPYAMMSQGQAAFLQQTQEAASNVIDAADARTRHGPALFRADPSLAYPLAARRSTDPRAELNSASATTEEHAHMSVEAAEE